MWVCAFVMLALTIWWFTKVFPAPKLEYNLTHNYYAIIPLTSYVDVDGEMGGGCMHYTFIRYGRYFLLACLLGC